MIDPYKDMNHSNLLPSTNHSHVRLLSTNARSLRFSLRPAAKQPLQYGLTRFEGTGCQDRFMIYGAPSTTCLERSEQFFAQYQNATEDRPPDDVVVGPTYRHFEICFLSDKEL